MPRNEKTKIHQHFEANKRWKYINYSSKRLVSSIIDVEFKYLKRFWERNTPRKKQHVHPIFVWSKLIQTWNICEITENYVNIILLRNEENEGEYGTRKKSGKIEKKCQEMSMEQGPGHLNVKPM